MNNYTTDKSGVITFASYIMSKRRKMDFKKSVPPKPKKKIARPSEEIFGIIRRLGDEPNIKDVFSIALSHYSQADIVKSMNKLELEGKIVVHQKGKIEVVPRRAPGAVATIVSGGKVVRGMADITKSGDAFVIVHGSEKDVFVQQRFTHGALQGDLVDVRLRDGRGSRPEGAIIEIVKRSQESFEGTIYQNKIGFYFKPKEEKIGRVFKLDNSKTEYFKEGDKVIARILNWTHVPGLADAEVIEHIDDMRASDLEMKRILIQNGFHTDFPEEVYKELNAIPDTIPQSEIDKRLDFRNVLTFTIDPEDAKDFDDAISVQLLENRNLEVGVHIADVSHYIKKGSVLDLEGEKRATSVYLPDRVCPMLPERLSNFLCSLRPNEDKLTFSVIFEFHPESSELLHVTFGKTIIHSKRRYSYEQAQEIIESGEGENAQELMMLNKISKKLRNKRSKNGAISFEKPEVRFKLDETGKPIGIYTKVRKDAHLLIEDFMLLANESVAKFGSKVQINKTPSSFVYRVHAKPDQSKLEQFAFIAKRFGYNVKFKDEKEVAGALNALLLKVQGKTEQNLLESLAIRCMAKAEYTTKNIGHYGLAMEYYTHFTSPIRRYPDVMVHRLLFDALNGVKILPDKEEIENACRISSQMERKAMEAEREATKYKQVEFLLDKIGQEFEGIISGVIGRGLFIELTESKCEGMLPVDELGDENFIFDETGLLLEGTKSHKQYRMGDAIRVKIKGASLAERKIDFTLVVPKK